MFMKTILAATLALSAQASLAQDSQAEGKTEITREQAMAVFQNMNAEQKAQVTAMLNPQSLQDGYIKMSSGRVRKYMPIVCAKVTAGALIMGGTSLSCISADLKLFTVTAFGAFQIQLEASANIAGGFLSSDLTTGIYPLDFSAAGYKFVGGGVLSGGGINLVFGGPGLGGHITWGVPSDSMFGGQLEVKVMGSGNSSRSNGNTGSGNSDTELRGGGNPLLNQPLYE